MIQSLKASIQEFLQREKASKEVAALLQQHLDIRPVSPSSYSVASQATAITAALSLSVFMFQFFRHPAPILPPSLSLIIGILILILAVASPAIMLLLPIRYWFAWYTPTLQVLLSFGGFVGCFTLAFYLLPSSDYLIEHNRVITSFFAGMLAWAAISLPFSPFLYRKNSKVVTTLARADLIQTHLALEQISLTRKHLLKRPKAKKNQSALEQATQEDIPRFYLARHPDGTYTVAFKADLPIPIMQRLAEMQPKTAFTDHEAVKRVLAEDAPCEDIWTGKIYTFPEIAAPLNDPNVMGMPITWDRGWEAGEQEDVQEDDEERDEEERKVISRAGEEWDTSLLAYVVDERIVAGCHAQKINDVAAEAWVQPEPSNGKEARQVTLAWASTMQRSGKIPFFSHHVDDEGAANLALGLGLPLVVEEVDYY